MSEEHQDKTNPLIVNGYALVPAWVWGSLGRQAEPALGDRSLSRRACAGSGCTGCEEVVQGSEQSVEWASAAGIKIIIRKIFLGEVRHH